MVCGYRDAVDCPTLARAEEASGRLFQTSGQLSPTRHYVSIAEGGSRVRLEHAPGYYDGRIVASRGISARSPHGRAMGVR
jgi:hypothetical protein